MRYRALLALAFAVACRDATAPAPALTRVTVAIYPSVVTMRVGTWQQFVPVVVAQGPGADTTSWGVEWSVIGRSVALIGTGWAYGVEARVDSSYVCVTAHADRTQRACAVVTVRW